MSRHQVRGGDSAGLLVRFAELQAKAHTRTGQLFPLIVIQEAGLDGFWIHRVLQTEGIESHIVDPASIATSRRRRRAKTDKIDGEALVRALLAYKRGEPRVCAMVRAPTSREEDERRICRERKSPDRRAGRARQPHQGSAVRARHLRLRAHAPPSPGAAGRTQDRRWPAFARHLKAQVSRELDRLELLLEQLKAVEAERDALLAATEAANKPAPAKLLLGLKGVGPEFASVLWSEGLYRNFANRRQVAAYAGLAPTPWQSGAVDREQGVSKAGNPRLRTTMIQLAWLWLRHQPDSALSRWFHERVERGGGRPQDDDRRARPKAAGCAVEVCDSRCRDRGAPR